MLHDVFSRDRGRVILAGAIGIFDGLSGDDHIVPYGIRKNTDEILH